MITSKIHFADFYLIYQTCPPSTGIVLSSKPGLNNFSLKDEEEYSSH
jgi:hypothetical protein